MDLNLKKCKCMVFSRRHIILPTYLINSCPLETVTTFLDFGMLVDMKLSFMGHISMVIGKARTVIDFVKRWAREFIDPLYNKTAILHLLEYTTIILNPYYLCHSDSKESVQKQFLLFCLRGWGWDYANEFPSYVLDICFVFNLIKSDIDSDFLLRITTRFSRHYRPFSIDFFRTNYGCNFPFRRLCNNLTCIIILLLLVVVFVTLNAAYMLTLICKLLYKIVLSFLS